jgi:anti-sigma factor RsiW
MSCRRFRKSLIDYADGTLSGARADGVRAHVESCEECKASLDKLKLSGSALGSLATVKMPEASAERVLRTLRSSAEGAVTAGRSMPSRLGFLWSPRTLAGLGTAAALLIAIVVVAIVFSGGGPSTTKPSSGLQNDGLVRKTSTAPGEAESTSPGEKKAQALVPANAAAIMPVVKVSDNNYDDAKLRTTFDSMEVKKEIAKRYSMTHAITMCTLFRRKMADMMVEEGQDGACLEAMIIYLTNSEPVLLPYYAEKAQYLGQGVFIIGFAGPRRTSDTGMLTRTEIWVMNPEKFVNNPDSGIVYFLEEKTE